MQAPSWTCLCCSMLPHPPLHLERLCLYEILELKIAFASVLTVLLFRTSKFLRLFDSYTIRSRFQTLIVSPEAEKSQTFKSNTSSEIKLCFNIDHFQRWLVILCSDVDLSWGSVIFSSDTNCWESSNRLGTRFCESATHSDTDCCWSDTCSSTVCWDSTTEVSHRIFITNPSLQRKLLLIQPQKRGKY